MFSGPSALKRGIGESGVTHDGQFSCRVWNRRLRPLLPSCVRSGAPRFSLPRPAYVWQVMHPDWENSLAPGCASFGRSRVAFANAGSIWSRDETVDVSIGIAPGSLPHPASTSVV